MYERASQTVYETMAHHAMCNAQFLSILEWSGSCSSLFCMLELEYITHLNIAPDELHIMHLGSSMCMLGSILPMLVFRVVDGSPQKNLDQVRS